LIVEGSGSLEDSMPFGKRALGTQGNEGVAVWLRRWDRLAPACQPN
jgi:hypothetical protein